MTLVTPCPFYKICPLKPFLWPSEPGDPVPRQRCHDRWVLDCPFFREYARELLLFIYNMLREGEEFDAVAFRVRRVKDGLEVVLNG